MHEEGLNSWPMYIVSLIRFSIWKFGKKNPQKIILLKQQNPYFLAMCQFLQAHANFKIVFLLSRMAIYWGWQFYYWDDDLLLF